MILHFSLENDIRELTTLHAFRAQKINYPLLYIFSIDKASTTTTTTKRVVKRSRACVPGAKVVRSFSSTAGVLLINWIRPTPDELYELSGSGLYFGPDSNLRSWVDFSLGHRQIYLAAAVVARFASLSSFSVAATAAIIGTSTMGKKNSSHHNAFHGLTAAVIVLVLLITTLMLLTKRKIAAERYPFFIFQIIESFVFCKIK